MDFIIGRGLLLIYLQARCNIQCSFPEVRKCKNVAREPQFAKVEETFDSYFSEEPNEPGNFSF